MASMMRERISDYEIDEPKAEMNVMMNKAKLFCAGILLGMGISFLYLKSMGNSDVLVESSFDVKTLRKELHFCRMGANDSVASGANSSTAPPSHTTIQPPPGGESRYLTITQMHETLKVIEGVQKEILEMYGLEDEDIKKGLWTAKGTRQHLINRMRAKIAAPGSRFVVSFTGMSVCAGHGSYINESYPLVFGATLKKAFDAAHVKLDVRNQCMGGTYTYPYAWCLTNIAGADVDVISWDFGMMEAGRPHITKAYLRQVLHMPSKPAVLFMAGYANELLTDSSGGALTLVRGIPRTDGRRLGIAMSFSSSYNLPTHGFWVAPILREKYNQLKVPESQRSDRQLINNFIELSPKDHTKTTPPALKDLREFTKKGLPGQASWHPAPKEHALMAKLLAYNYLDILSTAMQLEIQKSTVKKNEEALTIESVISEIGKGKDEPCDRLAEPYFCDLTFQCATSYEPREGHGLVDLLQNEVYEKKIAPADNTALAEVIKFKTGYRDRKYAYAGTFTDGAIGFRLHHVSSSGTVIVCEPTYGWRKPPQVADIFTEVEYFLDSHKLELPTEVNSKVRKETKTCVVVTENCPAGGHDLSMRPIVDKKTLYVSFVMWT